MQVPLQITFRGMEPSTAVESRIREKATKLERFHGRITGCKVVVDMPHRQHKHGTLYAVRVELGIPGREILASKGIGENHAHEDVYVAVRDAFDAVIRQLEGEIRVRRDHQRSERNQPDS
ncbi:MAG TPA: HPF/RaiA family ribosome-associated protein [Polyangiaceae bacterium]